MFKKIVAMTIMVCFILPLTGCWNMMEIDKMNIVSCLAIDKGQNGKKYHLSAEIINLEPESEKPTKIVEISEDTIFDATRKLLSVTSRKLYYAHCKTIIMSEDIAKEGIIPILDILMRHFSSRINIEVLVSKHASAKEILFLQSLRNSPNGFEIDTLLRNDENELSATKRMVLFEAVNELKSETISLTMPSIQIKPKEPIEKDKKESNFEVSGLGVFEKDKLVGFMDGDEVKYFLIATNKLKVGPLSIKINLDENSFISSQILKNKTKYKFFEKNNQIYFQVKTDSTVNIVNIATEKHYHDDYELKNLQKMLENNIKQDIEQLIITMQKKFDTDVFGFGDYIYRNDLKLWKKYQDNWAETFKNLNVEVTSKVNIINQGNMNSQIKGEES